MVIRRLAPALHAVHPTALPLPREPDPWGDGDLLPNEEPPEEDDATDGGDDGG